MNALVGWLQRRWYRPGAVWLLLPLAWLFGALVALRRRRYRLGRKAIYRSPLPVIVVGNLAVGGAGKTPVVQALALALRERGWRPGIVSRGYGGRQREAALLPERPAPALHGDEPCLLRRATGVPVAVAARRAEAVRLLEACGEVDLVIADDGLQHYALARDVELLVVDGAHRFGNGALLPAGPLREPLARALEVDFRLVNGGEPGEQEFGMRLRPCRLRRLVDRSELGLDWLVGRRVHAVAGIAHPDRFFATLRALGAEPIEHAFADHHAFRASDLAFGEGLPVLMTAKDGVKCEAFAAPHWLQLEVEAELPQALLDGIEQRLRALQNLEAVDHSTGQPHA